MKIVMASHIFASNDLNLSNELNELFISIITVHGNGRVITPGENFVNITQLFAEAKTNFRR